MEREGGRSGQQQWGKEGVDGRERDGSKGRHKERSSGRLDMWGILSNRVKNIFVILAWERGDPCFTEVIQLAAMQFCSQFVFAVCCFPCACAIYCQVCAIHFQSINFIPLVDYRRGLQILARQTTHRDVV